MKLRRFEDSSGSSAGYWIVDGIKGLCLVRQGEGWVFQAGPPWLKAGLSRSFYDSWDKGLDGIHLLRQNPRLQEVFRTRRQALSCLTLELDSSSALTGLL